MAGGKTLDYPKSKATKIKYDAFIRAYWTNGKNGAKAAETAGYSKKHSRQQAVHLLSIPYIQEELKKLEEKEKQTFDEYIAELGLTVRDRLEMLNNAIELGFKRNRFGGATDISAAIRAIGMVNEMLGTDERETETQAFNISFNVKPAKGNVRITNA